MQKAPESGAIFCERRKGHRLQAQNYVSSVPGLVGLLYGTQFYEDCNKPLKTSPDLKFNNMKTKGYHIGLLSPKCGRFPEECIVERWVGTINQDLKELEDP